MQAGRTRMHLGNDGRSGASGREEEVHYSSLGIVRDTEARVSPVRIPSVEGCARYDDYRASWTRLIPTTRRLHEDAPRARSFHGLYANFLMRHTGAL